MKNHETNLKNHGNQPKTMRNHEYTLKTMKNHETTLKNHGNQPKTMKNPETTGFSWFLVAGSQLTFMTQNEKVIIFRYLHGVTTVLHDTE